MSEFPLENREPSIPEESFLDRIRVIRAFLNLQRYEFMSPQQALSKLIHERGVRTMDDYHIADSDDGALSELVETAEVESEIVGFRASIWAPWQIFYSHSEDRYGRPTVMKDLHDRTIFGTVTGLVVDANPRLEQPSLGLEVDVSILVNGEVIDGSVFSPLGGTSITFCLPELN